MATTVTGKLNRAATQFQAGESTGFGVRVGVQFYNRETKMQEWCNYEAVIFAKAPAQIQFYQSVLVEGTVIEISGHKQRIKQYQGANGLQLSIEILDAQLGVAYAPPVPAQQQPAQQQRPQQPQNNNNQRASSPYGPGGAAPNYGPAATQQQQQQQPPIDFDHDIPF